MTTSRSNREVRCERCGYHYRARTGRMVANHAGWVCADTIRCNHNLAQQAKYRRTP